MVLHALNGAQGRRTCVGLPFNAPREEVRNLVDQSYEIYQIESDGQAHTVLQLIEQGDVVGPVVVINSDLMLVSSAAIPAFVAAMEQVGTAESGALVTPQEDAASYSFVSETGWFQRAAEKRRISAFAMVGVYWFADALELARRLRTVVSFAKGEPFLSAVFALYDKNWAVTCQPSAVAEFGTPEKLRATIERFR